MEENNATQIATFAVAATRDLATPVANCAEMPPITEATGTLRMAGGMPHSIASESDDAPDYRCRNLLRTAIHASPPSNVL